MKRHVAQAERLEAGSTPWLCGCHFSSRRCSIELWLCPYRQSMRLLRAIFRDAEGALQASSFAKHVGKALVIPAVSSSRRSASAASSGRSPTRRGHSDHYLWPGVEKACTPCDGPEELTEILIFQSVVVVVHLLPNIFQKIIVLVLARHCKTPARTGSDTVPLAIGGSVNSA